MIKLNQDSCLGCGACASIAPANFSMNNEGKAEVVNQEVSDITNDAMASCPVQAIEIE